MRMCDVEETIEEVDNTTSTLWECVFVNLHDWGGQPIAEQWSLVELNSLPNSDSAIIVSHSWAQKNTRWAIMEDKPGQ